MSANVNVLVIGSKDHQLDELLLSAGLRAKHGTLADLERLTSPAAVPPQVLILDQRAEEALPPSLASLKRQHPATGVIILSSSLQPALMLEAMRAGVSEWLTVHHLRRTSAGDCPCPWPSN